MTMAFRFGAPLALAATLAMAASPAAAHRGWYGGYHHHDHDDGFGIFLGLAALIGAGAIIASSADKNSRAARQSVPQDNYPPPPPPASDGRHYDEGDATPNGDYPGGRTSTQAADEDAAVNDCAMAARDEGSQNGQYAEVRDIKTTRPIDNGWSIDGTVDQRQGYRGNGVTRRFSCTWRAGRVADLVLSRDTIALR